MRAISKLLMSYIKKKKCIYKSNYANRAMKKNFKELSTGCILCSEGKKSVLFITGICPRKCIYCPISKEKKNKDIMHINELRTSNIKEILNEISKSNSTGIGITGGDPLSRLSRTKKIIKAIKRKFGKKFHIHLYTSLNLINENSVNELQKSGLDELRVHPDIRNKKLWGKIKLLKGKFKETGIEIPAFPNEEKRISELINFAKGNIDFFNLNELEYATLYEKEYKKRKWKINEDYSVEGSKKTALKIIKQHPEIRIHYCSSKFKDAVQFANRIKQRAKKSSEKFDKITNQGLLIRGEIHAKSKDLKKLKNHLEKKYNQIFKIDKKKSRIIFSPLIAKKISKYFKNVAIVEEYPTTDALETEKEWLS